MRASDERDSGSGAADAAEALLLALNVVHLAALEGEPARALATRARELARATGRAAVDLDGARLERALVTLLDTARGPAPAGRPT